MDEKPTSTCVSVSKTPVSAAVQSSSTTPGSSQAPKTPGQDKQLKRKLFSQQQPQLQSPHSSQPPGRDSCAAGHASADEEDKRGSTPKRRKSVHSDHSVGSPPAASLTSPNSTSGKGGRLSVPLSERQQMALLRQQYAANVESTAQGETSPRPSSPGTQASLGKKTPLDKKIHKKNEKGETLLHIAAIRGDGKQCKKLIKAGADVNVRDNAGWTPLHEACNHGFFAIAKQLLRNGANVNVQGCENDTPLHDASINGHKELVELLLRHGANPLQQNTRGKAPIDIAADDSVLKLLKSETLASSSSGGSVTSEVRSPTSPESMSEDDDLKSKKDTDSFFSGRGSHMSLHSPTSTTAHAPRPDTLTHSPPKADPYDFSDNDSTNPSTHFPGSAQRLTLKLKKSQKERREREERNNDLSAINSPKRALHSYGSGSGATSSMNDDSQPPPSKRFKSFNSRLSAGAPTAEEAGLTTSGSSIKFGTSGSSIGTKFDTKSSALDRLSPASFSSQDSDLMDAKLDISAFSSGQRDTIVPSSGLGASPLTFANVTKVTSADSSLLGNNGKRSGGFNSDIRGKSSSFRNLSSARDHDTSHPSDMPKLSQESGPFSPRNFGDSDDSEDKLQIDIDSTVPSTKPSGRETSSATQNSKSTYSGNSASYSQHNRNDVSSSNADNSAKSSKKSPTSSANNRSPSPFRFTDSPTSSISPGQSLYSNKHFDRSKNNDSNASSTSTFGGFSYKSGGGKSSDHQKHDKTKHKDSSSRQSPQSVSDLASKKTEDQYDHSPEVSQSSVKSSGSYKSMSADSTRHFSSLKADNSSSKSADSKSKSVLKQDQKDDSRHTPSSSTSRSDKSASNKQEKDRSTKPESGSEGSRKQDKDSSNKSSPKSTVDTSRYSPRPHTKETGSKNSPTGTSPLSSSSAPKWDTTRGSPRSDRGDRDSPKSDRSDKSSDIPKVPPLKIIMPTDHHHNNRHNNHSVPSTKITVSVRGGSLPYVVNPTQDGANGAEGAVGSSGAAFGDNTVAPVAAANGATVTSMTGVASNVKNSRSSSRASSVASGGGTEIDVISADPKGEDSNHRVSSSTQQDGSNCRSRRDRDELRVDDEESRDGISRSDDRVGSDKGSSDAADKAEDTSERRVTRSQLRSLKNSGSDSKDYKEPGKEENSKDGTVSEKDKMETNTNEKENSGNVLKSSIQNNRTEEEPIAVPPRKRKLRQRQQQENSTIDITQYNFFPRTQHQDKTLNPYEMYLDIRKKVAKRHLEMSVVTPKPPRGFKDYLMVNCNYVLQGNGASCGAVQVLTPPTSLEDAALKDLFTEQEKARYKLRLQHHIEREKLMLSIEQEIVRVHGRAARAQANQTTPLSVCTVLRDQEIYNPITDDKDKNGVSGGSGGGAQRPQRHNGRQFLSWLQDVGDKYEKIKESLLMRHHHEAESLHAVQKLEWQWKIRDALIGSDQTPFDDSNVPMVQVNDEFELLPS